MVENIYCNILDPSSLKIEVILTHTDIVAFFCLSPSSLKPDFFSGFDEFFAFPRQAAAVLSNSHC